MHLIERTPLERWLAGRMALPAGRRPGPERLIAWQLERLNNTLSHAAAYCLFYRDRWKGQTPRLNAFEDLQGLPFTTDTDLCGKGKRFLGVSQSDVARVVTLHTSGTTGEPKRIYFTDGDLAGTVDFFHHGMTTLVQSGRRVLILLPGERPDSVGDLLRKGLARMDAEGIVHGPVNDPAHTIETIIDEDVDCLVGIPSQVLGLVRHPQGDRLVGGKIRSVLLSTDYVPQAIVNAIVAAWGCTVYQHYGMTEMGYGGGVSCGAHHGYHLREADLLFEIIDPATGRQVPDGRMGEVVFTTLSRRAMPLIRYRTGDLAAWIDEPCPCGSVLRRMGYVQGRRREAVRLGRDLLLDLPGMDEALYALPELLDFQAAVRSGRQGDDLEVVVYAGKADDALASRAGNALMQVPAIRKAVAGGALHVKPVKARTDVNPYGTVAKRRIADQRI